ncbi:MAG: hypothetical protein JXR48_01170 [Candidatus Delongbacteria bacterium]|nr:hypothetical protein [Candidatus Delongbacteria bacterium]MBN2833554.1 hypothetical protein [Candidatus Delongbacteria bacterium]
MNFSNLKVKTKIIIIVVSLVVVLASVLGYSAYNISKNVLLDNLGFNLQSIAIEASHRIESEIKFHKAIIEGIANRNVIKSMDWEIQKQALSDEVQRTEFLALGIVNNRGIAKYNDGTEADLNGREYLEKAWRGETVMTDVIISKVTKSVVIMVATPIIDGNNSKVGVLIGRLSGDMLTNVTDQIKYGKNGYSFVVDGKGTLISHTNRDFIMNQLNFIDESKSKPEFKEVAAVLINMISHKTSNESYDFFGSRRYMGYCPVQGTAWSLAVGSFESEVLEPVYSMRNTFFIIISFVFIIGLIVSIFISSTIKKIFDNLLEQINNSISVIVSGDLKFRADTTKISDEFKPILISLNDLIEAFVTPINLTNDYLNNISSGVIPELIKNEMRGDFGKIKNSLNNLISLNLKISQELNHTIENAKTENFGFRANSEGLSGEWRELIKGVNLLMKISEDFLKKVNENMKIIEKEGEVSKLVTEYQNFEVNKISEILDRVAEGDLTVIYTPENADENTKEVYALYTKISNSLNKSMQELNNVLSEVKNAAYEIDAGSSQLSEASQSLSAGSTEQSSSIEELTATMTEISSQTRMNAENANMASKLVTEAKDASESGNNQMNELSSAMNEITSSAKEIMKVIKVIDDIAFQTNLLALNAAVEAARAGIHGKGFAVVADEVRNLAQRSAEAAKETTGLIEDSVKKTETGNQLSQKTVKSLSEIKKSVLKATELVEEIAIASEEQAKGIEQSNVGLSQVSKVTQSNAANAEETASAAVQLSSQAERLKEAISVFIIDDGIQKPMNYENNNRRKVPKKSNKLLTTNHDDFGDF